MTAVVDALPQAESLAAARGRAPLCWHNTMRAKEVGAADRQEAISYGRGAER